MIHEISPNVEASLPDNSASGLFIEDDFDSPPRTTTKNSVSSSADLRAESGALNVLQHRIRDVISNW